MKTESDDKIKGRTKKANSRRMHILGRLGIISLCIIAVSCSIIFMLINNTIINA